jgi:hypothetical protein
MIYKFAKFVIETVIVFVIMNLLQFIVHYSYYNDAENYLVRLNILKNGIVSYADINQLIAFCTVFDDAMSSLLSLWIMMIGFTFLLFRDKDMKIVFKYMSYVTLSFVVLWFIVLRTPNPMQNQKMGSSLLGKSELLLLKYVDYYDDVIKDGQNNKEKTQYYYRSITKERMIEFYEGQKI